MPDSKPPRWDLTPIFPSLDSPEFQEEFDATNSEFEALTRRFDELGIRRRDDPTVNGAVVAAFEEVTGRLNAVMQKLRTLGSYVGCLVSTDARNEAALAWDSRLDGLGVRLDQLRTRFTAWAGTMELETLLQSSQVARDHRHFLTEAQDRARHQMSEDEECLAAELRPAGLLGWARMHGNMSALLTAEVPVDGEVRVLPMSSVRALAAHPDRETRRRAFEAELKMWEAVSVPFAAALNGIKGYQSTLRRRRDYADDVEPTLRANGIDREILEAMQQACVDSFPDFRRYMGAKARAIGVPRLAWYDLDAPLGDAGRPWRWSEAEEFVRENFAGYSDRLAEFAVRSYRERWIDAEPRVGKEGGGYCTGILPGISRIFMNFDNTFLGVTTLAHELGHAYHNLQLADRAPLQRMTPSTLAETASIFCETLAFDAAVERANPAEKLGLLDTALNRNLGVVVDIHSRFLFESAVFERRAERDLTVGELCMLMEDAQRKTYGDDVEPLHPYMWAVKGHYYGPTFYNYPYTFGLLFGLGLYALYKRDPDGFRSRYDDLLSRTGMADARTLGAEFGMDVASPTFWRSSLDVIRGQIDEIESLAVSG